jgi:hypothetical protein
LQGSSGKDETTAKPEEVERKDSEVRLREDLSKLEEEERQLREDLAELSRDPLEAIDEIMRPRETQPGVVRKTRERAGSPRRTHKQ